MASLSNQWLTEGWIDFEYKKYQLQAFLQEASNNFDAKKLYPKLSELISSLRAVASIFHTKKSCLQKAFRKKFRA
jgi:hypothetical protein